MKIRGWSLAIVSCLTAITLKWLASASLKSNGLPIEYVPEVDKGANSAVMSFQLHATNDRFKPYVGEPGEPTPSAFYYSRGNDGILIVESGAKAIFPRKIEVHYNYAGPIGESAVSGAQAYLLRPIGTPCSDWSNETLTSIDLKSRGCRFEMLKPKSAEITVNTLPYATGSDQRISSALMWAEFPDKEVGTVNFLFKITGVRAR